MLVTHDMATVQSFCDRAMLIHDGERLYIGDAEEAALRYYRLNFGGDRTNGAGGRAASPTSTCASSTPGCDNEAGERVENVEQGESIGLDVVFEARHDLEDPVFGFHFLNANGETVFGFNRTLTVPDGEPRPHRRGPARADRGDDRQPAAARALPRQLLDLAQPRAGRSRPPRGPAARLRRASGRGPGPGSVSVNADVEAGLEPRRAPSP